LAAHPVIADYRRVARLRRVAAGRPRRRSRASRLGRGAVARGFAWMFSGARLPAPRLVDLALAAVERWSA